MYYLYITFKIWSILTLLLDVFTYTIVLKILNMIEYFLFDETSRYKISFYLCYSLNTKKDRLMLVLICVTKWKTELKNEIEGRITRYYLRHSDDSDRFQRKTFSRDFFLKLYYRYKYCIFSEEIYLSGTV